MDAYHIHAVIEHAGTVLASGNFSDHTWNTIEACKDYLDHTVDPVWLKAKEWLEMASHAKFGDVNINYTCEVASQDL